MAGPEYLFTEWCLIIDTREQAPFQFRGLRSDAKGGNRPLIPTIVHRVLTTGDYSIEGFEHRIAVERKSMEDFWSCCGTDRQRFQLQLERLNQLEVAAVVVEADWGRLQRGIESSKLSPKSVFRSVVAWQQRLPRVHWWMCASRSFAETVTFRILQRFWEDNQRGDRNESHGGDNRET